jgi:hypothetical protein
MSTGEERMAAPKHSEVVPMVEPEVVRQMRELSAMGWGSKRIVQELGVARNTVKRYLRYGADAEIQVRPGARCLDADARAEAKQLFVTVAEGNAVVVAQELATRGIEASVRTVQRAVEDERRAKIAAEVATVRYETAPGQQMQVDFGEKRVSIAGVLVKVFLLAAVLGYSRRIFVLGVRRVLQGLGRGAARLHAVPSAHQGKGREVEAVNGTLVRGPCMRRSAWIVHASRCRSSSAKLANSRPASAFRFTNFTPLRNLLRCGRCSSGFVREHAAIAVGDATVRALSDASRKAANPLRHASRP